MTKSIPSRNTLPIYWDACLPYTSITNHLPTILIGSALLCPNKPSSVSSLHKLIEKQALPAVPWPSYLPSFIVTAYYALCFFFLFSQHWSRPENLSRIDQFVIFPSVFLVPTRGVNGWWGIIFPLREGSVSALNKLFNLKSWQELL